VLLGLGATVALPEENNSLAYEHSDGTGGQASKDTEDGRDDNEAENTGESVGESAVRGRWVMVTVMAVGRRGRAVAHLSTKVTIVMGVVGATTMVLHGEEVFEFGEWWCALGELVVVLGRAVVATHAHRALVLAMAALLAATFASHAKDAVMSGGKKTTHARNQKLLDALGLAITLLPGQTLGGRSGLLNLGLGDVELTGGVLDQGDGDGVDRDGVSLEIENGESDIEEIGSGSVVGGSQRHHL
jgi:hypothetical protein